MLSSLNRTVILFLSPFCEKSLDTQKNWYNHDAVNVVFITHLI